MIREYLKFEDKIGAAVVSALAGAGLAVPTAAIGFWRDSITATTPRIAVRISGVERVDDHMSMAVGVWNHDLYAAQIEVETTTRRIAGQDHDGDVAKIRQAFAIPSQSFSASSTYYQFLDFEERGSSRAVDAEQREDSTAIFVRTLFAIERTAFGIFDTRTTSDGTTRTTSDGNTRHAVSL